MIYTNPISLLHNVITSLIVCHLKEKIKHRSYSKNLKRSESLMLIIAQVVELYTFRDIDAFKNLYIMGILSVGQMIFQLV